jgi:hypothetical protein
MIALTRSRTYLISLAAAGTLVGGLAAVVAWTRPVRESVRTYTELLGAANRQDVEAARRLCSSRYALTHPLSPAPDGGLVGLPRNIHKNFQAWQEGANVWLCPTNRVGPVYQFVREEGAWKFDGPVGILQGRGHFAPLEDGGAAEPSVPPPGAD